MVTIFTRLSFVFFILFSSISFSADIPQDSIGSQKLTKTECIANASQDCINSNCLNSESVDCQDNCRTMAKDKCQQMHDE